MFQCILCGLIYAYVLVSKPYMMDHLYLSSRNRNQPAHRTLVYYYLLYNTQSNLTSTDEIFTVRAQWHDGTLN